MLQSVYTNKLGYKTLVVLMDEDDNPAFGTPISVDLQDWLSPRAADILWDRGFIRASEFFEKSGVYDAMLAAVRIDYPSYDRKKCIIKANEIVEAIRRELS